MKATVELAQEGITQKMIDEIDLKKDFSPIMLDSENGQVQYSHPAKSGFWVSEKMQIFRDSSGSAIKFTNSHILVARARFKLHYPAGLPKIDKRKVNQREDKLTPMFTAHYNNPEEMRMLKNVFSVEALEKANFDPRQIQKNLDHLKAQNETT